MSLEQNVALYEQIFYTLVGDGVVAKSPFPSRGDEAPGVGHSGV